MTMFDEAGFLSDEAESHSKQVEGAHSEWLRLAIDLSQYVNRLKKRLTPRNDVTPHLVSAALLTRALSSFEGVILHIRRGMRAEANGNLRMLVETMFLQGAIRADDRTAEEIRKAERAQLRKAVIHYRDLVFEKGESSDPAAWARVEQAAKGLEGVPLKTLALAELAGYGNLYANVYVPLSWSVHAQWTDLKRHLLYDEEGVVKGLQHGPDDSEARWQLVVATEALKRVTEDCLAIVPVGPDDQWNALVQRQADLIREDMSN